MNQPWVYMCSPSWTPLPPPSPSHPSVSSQCTSREHPVSCIKPGLTIYFIYGNIHISMLFSQIIPPWPSSTESKSLIFISVSLLLSRIYGPKWITNKVVWYTTGNSTYHVTAWMGEEFGDGYMYVCGRVLSLSTETITLLLMSYIPIENTKFKLKKKNCFPCLLTFLQKTESLRVR